MPGCSSVSTLVAEAARMWNLIVVSRPLGARRWPVPSWAVLKKGCIVGLYLRGLQGTRFQDSGSFADLS